MTETPKLCTAGFWAACIALFTLGSAACAQTPPYRNPALPLKSRIADLMSRMTLSEKANQLFWGAGPNARFGIPAFGGWNQDLHGVWSKQPTTLFPTPIAMAATWDPALIKHDAAAIGDEARALYNIHAKGPYGPVGLICRAPVINLARDPRWGRIQECFGEDPTLTGQIGVAYVRGLQGNNPKYLRVAATLKHFAVYSQETGRLSHSVTVSDRMLMEYYLPHWKMCVQQGHAQSIMAAYNAVNGVPCAMNRTLLTDILRDQWGFRGFVTSDLGGIQHLVDGHHVTAQPEVAAAMALQAGCDYDDQQYRDDLPLAVSEGLISEADVDRALGRVLRVGFRLGVFDPPGDVPYTKLGASEINSPAHRALARKTADESIVLLQNNAQFLPLNPAHVKKIAVIGPMGDHYETGSYFGALPPLVGPLQGIQQRLGPGVSVTYSPGCSVTGAPGDATAIAQAVQAAQGADAVILSLGTNSRVEREGIDRANLNLPPVQEQLLEAVAQANPRIVLVLMNGGPLAVTWAKAHVPAILETWYNGEEAGSALAAVLFGDENPCGKLPYTMYASTANLPPQSDYEITDGETYLYYRGTPLFPFGDGLSYTTFGYEHLGLSANTVPQNGMLTVQMTVQNTGQRAGAEVVQLYVHQEVSRVPQPIQKLVGFQRIFLKPGQRQTVRFTLAASQLAWYDEARQAFRVEPGVFDVSVGSSSADLRLHGHFRVLAAQRK